MKKIKFLMLIFSLGIASISWAQTTVTGTVTDELNTPLPGATVLEKGTTNGTTTDFDGNFSIDVANGNVVLEFSYIGYSTMEAAVNGRSSISVQLAEDATQLEDVVVVGYGVQKKSDVTGSISSIKSEDFNQGVVANPGQLLQGKLAGVNVSNVSGEPGANQNIIIRGVGSLRSGTTPLFVVDGFVIDNSSTGLASNPLNFINPQDIASMDVLKDASATAIYGARAANGVIVITTKKGKAGKTEMNLNVSTAFATIANPMDVFSASEFRNQVAAVGGTLFDAGANTDWQDELTRTGISKNVNFSMSGGTADKSSYFVSTGVDDQQGTFENSSLKRYSGPGRITQSAVWGFLARLNLNAAVYRDPYGTPNFTPEDMTAVIQYTDNIINTGNFTLSAEYFELFNDANNSNAELIFALDQRGQLRREHSRWAYWSIAGSMFPRPEYPSADGTDGPAFTPDFFQSWVDAYGDVDPAEADARFFQRNTIVPDDLQDLTGLTPLNDEDHFYCAVPEDFEMDRGVIRGTQWGPRKGDDGTFFTCDGGVRIYPVLQRKGNAPDRDVAYVNHTLEIDFSNEGSFHNTGYRCAKYQFSRTSPNGNNFSSVDLVLMRLAEIYLMRSEAKLRNGDAGGALADLNLVRASRTARPDQTPPALAAIDTDILLRERGFELYWEGFRRGDQIRFGTYEDSWTEKTDSDPNKRLFPIPQSAVDAASGIDGFLEQNQGY